MLLFGASVLGSAHCVAMCGPYVAMCTAQFVPRGATPRARLALRLLFNIGRIATYSFIGLVAGAFGQVATAVAMRFGINGILAIAAGGTALIFGISMLGWIRDPARLLVTAALGRWLIAGRVRLSQAPPPAAPILLGALQGWLPCALVYAAASRASLAGSAGMGAFTMLVFGLGTVPAVFALTVVPQTLLKHLKTQRLAGALLALLGALLILRGLASLRVVPSTGVW